MIRVYVAGLYSRNADGSKAGTIDTLHNMRVGIEVATNLLRMGYAVFCPWLDFQFGLVDEFSPEVYKANSMAWLEVSDAVFVISGEGLGSGVDAEIARAKELNIPVCHFDSELYEITSNN